MKLLNIIKNLEKSPDVKDCKGNIKVAMIFTHDDRNAIGVMPYCEEGNPLRIFEYLAQGFLEECEVLTMAQTLIQIKKQNGKLYDECIRILNEKNYCHLGEVVDRIYTYENEVIN